MKAVRKHGWHKNMMNNFDLSIVIPASNKNGLFINETIKDILKNSEANTEVIVVYNGEWPDPPVPQYERVNFVHYSDRIGQRAATNRGVCLSRAKYIMKLDSHCAFDKGFDRIMLDAFKETGDNVVMVPTMRNLWAFDWKCYHCGWKKYQGPTPEKCGNCGETHHLRRKVMWIGKERPQSNSYCFDSGPHFQYFNDYTRREPYLTDVKTGLTESMSIQGSCFMCTREKYTELNLCDEEAGSWGNQGIEVACKIWLSGGRVIINHRTWYAHMFRTQGGDFSFSHQMHEKEVHATKEKIWAFFQGGWEQQIHPVSWLVQKFWPVTGWTAEQVQQLK
jgi:hypothetical protein